MITYGSTTLTSYNSITSTEVYYYKSSSATALSGGSWSTTKPAWENGKYIWQKIRTLYEDGTYTESDPVNITGQQGAGSANDAANASFYFAKIHPTSYTTNYKVKMKVRVTEPEAYAETIDIQFGGYGNTFSSYDSYTIRTGNVGIYYINLYRATQAGISTNHKGHALGVGLRSSTNPTNTSYKRTIIVDILELENCTIEMLDTAVKYANIDGTGSTNYSGLTEMYVATAGQNATNNTNTNYTQYANAVKAGTFGVKRYTLIMKETESTWSSFVNQANSIATTKTVNSSSGYLLGRLLYSAGGAEYASGANTSTVYDVYPFDFRYSSNCGTTLIAHKPVYLIGTVHDDGKFYFDVDSNVWYTQEPVAPSVPMTSDGKVYIYVGMTYSTYQVWLSTENPAYAFYNSEFILYDKATTLQDIKSLEDDIQSQIDGKIQTYYQSTNPASSWTTTELRTPHDGDLWYYTGTTTSTYIKDNVYRYNASNNTWSVYSASGELFDKVDGKSTIFYGTTSDTYTGVETGDYLVDSTDGSSYRWDGSKWVKVTDYKTTITNAIDNIEIGGRNLLLNSATEKTGASNVAQWMQWAISDSPLIANEDYMFSFDAKMSNSTDVFYIGFALNSSTQEIMKQEVLVTDTYKRYTYKVKTTKTNINSIIISNAKSYGHGNANNSTGVLNIKNIKLEKGNKATDWTPAPEDVTASIQAYVDTLQFQVDHMAEIYYGTAVPTLSNTPASDWTTNDIKDIHIDDLYYNTSTGYCYRFMKSGSTYSWSRIKDSDITAAATAASNANTAAGNAQTAANNANTLAGQKRRIFVAQPTPPYEIGDLWVEGSNGDIKKCKTARATGSYTASDWELASKYTDDTVANTANTKIDNLKKVRLGWKVNYSSFTSTQNGECYFHGYDSNNAPTDANGIVEWNGADLTITKGMWINPNTIAPYNIPILHVFRTNTSPYHADVWWDDTLRKWRGYMYTSNQLPATVVDWAWNETNDCILATYISPSNEGVITSGQLFNPPKKFSEINDPSDLYNELTTINDAIISRGEQLVINGNGMMGSNYNFSSLTFDGSKSNGSPGSFTRPAETVSRTIYSDEFFPVTPSNTYVLSFDLMSLNNLSTMYAFINFYDVDKKQIDAEMHMYCPNTLTTLSQDLKNGDTVVHLTDASNWETTGSYNHGLIFWNYVNSFGYQYPEHTYSRNKWDKLFDLNNINKTNNTITLNEAWNHGTFPTGTKLSQKNAGATFKYLGIVGSIVPNTWTSYKGRIGDIDYSGTNMMGMFPPGTAYAKVGFLWNYNKANDQTWVTNISVKEDVTRGTGFYAITTAPTAYTTQVGNFTPAYRIALSTVKTQSGLEEVMVGDVIQQGYNTYPVGYIDTSYVYLGSANSIRGATGATGLNNAQVILYRRFASAPSGTNVAPTGDVTYTFSTGKAANNLNSWTQNIPSGSDPVYMIAASASSTSSTDTIPKTEWSAPVKILENGQDGGTGSAGADGYNQATIFLYQRKSGTAPSKPSSAVTYTFSSGALNSTPTGWSRTIPTNDGNPCYVTTATAVAKTATYSIPANGWSDVVILSQDGEDGTSITITSTSVKYQKGTSGTTAPTGTWGTSIPSVGENEFLWTQTIVNYSDNSKTESYSVSRNAKNGTNGTSPTVSSTTVEYQQSTGGTTPPTGTWSTTAPTATAGQYMWTRTTVTYSDSKTAVSYSVSKNGTNGTSPTAYHLIVSHGAINKSQAGVNNPTTITLISKYQTGNGALNNYSGRFKIETTTDNNTWTQDSASSTANESSKTYTIPANIKAVRFSLYLAGGFTTLLDQQTVPVVTDGAKGDNGEDAYTIVLTNEAHTFPAGVSAALAGSATSNVMTYKGGVQVTCFVGSTSSATSISTGTTGLTCTINDNNSKNVSLTFTATTSLTTKAGTVTIPITVDNKAFSKTFTWSLANQGIKGEDGVSVTNVTSTNNTADGGTSVVTITLSNGTTKTFNVKNGSKGSQGDTGATAEWYYGTALTHISGSATLSPSSTSGAVVGSMYLNTKTSLVYKCTAVGTNNTWTYAGDLITGVIDNLQVGGKNLLLKEPRSFNPTTYNPYQLNLTEPLEANQPYTIQLWDVDVSNDKKTASQLGVNVYYCGGSVTFGRWAGEQYFTDGHADHLILTFTPTEANVTHSSVNNTTGAKYISLYNSVSDVKGSVKNLTIGKWQLEKGNVGTDWTLAPEDVENSIKAYAESIQSQVDGMAEIHYGTAVPTLSNAPYTSWKDTATRDMHVDDLYYNTSTGYCYRFIKSGSTYSWSRIKDSDITAAATAASNANTAAGNAQTAANNANTLAGQKRRIFVAQPTPPYEIGDLWVEGSNGDIKKCKTARATGSYTASDWELASKYTDDTLANEANDKIDNLEIGGRNLLPFKDCSSETLTRGGITLTKEEDGWIRVSGTRSGTSLTTFTLWQNPDGDTYTAPINSYVPQNGNTNQFTLSVETEGTPFIMGNTYTSSTHIVAYGSTSGTSWRIGGINGTSITGVFPTYMSVIRCYIGANSTGSVDGRFRVKLERGNKATDWTPAPEDTETAISDVQDTANTALIQSSWYAICDTAGATIDKVATISPTTTSFTLREGTTAIIKFVNTNSGAIGSLKLNVNNTGAKPIKYIYNGGLANIPSAGYLKGGQSYQFYYDGTNWVVQMIYNTNTNTVGVYGGTVTVGTNGIRGYTLIMRDTENTWVSITTDAGAGTKDGGTGTNHVKYAGGLYPDSVMYESTQTNYAAGASAAVCYLALSLNLRYSTNCGTTLIKNKPVYLVGELHNDGLFYLDDIWWTQTIPTTENGKTYIYLGMAYSNYQIYLATEKPMYQYYDGEFMTYEDVQTALAAKSATNYISSDNTGIMVADMTDGVEKLPSDTTLTGSNVFITAGYGSGNAAVPAGVHIRDGRTDIARFGATAQIGRDDEGHVLIDSDSVDIKNGQDVLASFGENTHIGGENNAKIQINGIAIGGIDEQGAQTFEISNNGTTQEMGYIINNIFQSMDFTKSSLSTPAILTYTIPQLIKNGSAITISFRCFNVYQSGLAFTYGTTSTSTINTSYVGGNITYDGENTFVFSVYRKLSANDTYIFTLERIAFNGTRKAPYFTFGTRKSNSSIGSFSFAEGAENGALGKYSHSEGFATIASKNASHAEGGSTYASGDYSHAEGYFAQATGRCAHAQNEGTRAEGDCQTTLGKYNIPDPQNVYAVIIGNGEDGTYTHTWVDDQGETHEEEVDKTSNALAITWDGNVEMALNTIATTGTIDNDLYTAITALGWEGDVIV